MLVLSVLEQGLIYGVMALGVYITYKILDFPDLTVDGSFPMGAAIGAMMVGGGIGESLTHLACKFCCRGGGRDIDRDYPCEIKSAGFVVWHYYDDGVVYH